MPKKIFYATGYQPVSFANTKSVNLATSSIDFSSSGADYSGNVPFSISIWNKYDRTFGGAGIIEMPDQFGFFLEANSTGIRPQIRIYSEGSISVRIGKVMTSFGVTRSVWNHYAVTYDGSGLDSGIKMYVNAALVSVNPVNAGVFVQISGSSAVSVGKYLTSRMFGLIDEAALLPIELTAAQVADIYNSGVPKSMASYSPDFWASFEDNLNDLISGNTGVDFAGTSTFSTDIPT